jgi:mono/diheme cytochrome c family protein
MTRKIATATTGAALALLALHGLKATPPAPPPGPALSLINERCVSCHTTDTIFSQRKSPADWSATVQLMADRGADVSPDEMATIADYLAKNFPAPAGAAPAAKAGPG